VLQQACLLKDHVVSRPCDLSTVVTCRLLGRTLLEDTQRCIGCSVKMYLAELARSDVSNNDNNKDVSVDDTTTATIMVVNYLLTFLLNYFMEQSPSWEANWFSASQEIPRIFGNRRFITVFTSARHLSLSWATWIQSMPPHPTSWISILILSSHLRLGLPSGLFPSGFPTKTLYTSLISPYVLHAHPISFF